MASLTTRKHPPHTGKTVVCDAGVHPAYTGLSALPFVDELDWSTVDALLITQ